MIRILLSVLIIQQTTALFAQKIEQGFDYTFKPTDYTPRYYVITEKKDSLWHREAYYLPERSLAMDGWYKDKDCKTAHGKVSWYYSNKFLKSTGKFIDGKKEGTWIGYNEKGLLEDSANYTDGRINGVKLHWYQDGMPSDSMQFDGTGNGVEVSWYEDGGVAAAGKWISDTLKFGRWQYFHRNGKIKAIEDYTEGKRVRINCFDEAGNQLDGKASEESEATFPGGLQGWVQFLQKNLNHNAPLKFNAPPGQYTAAIQFIIDPNGSISEMKPLTSFGYGMEEEAIRVLKKGPQWIPAQQFGVKVKAYRIQPVTFVISR